MPIKSRLSALNAKGLHSVTHLVSTKLREIKHTEIEAARKNPRKAAAQGRIIIPDAEEKVVRALCTWLYSQGDLVYDDAEHL
jgi:hypothetical protein